MRPCELAEPVPGSLIESLRAFGYSLPTAVADLIDNSLTAGASRIDVDLSWSGGTSTLSILDNGYGMSRSTLVDALRPGNVNPVELRAAHDLGRFGLGLKTASFSQCRRLTVQTKSKDGEVTRRTWDLDYVNASGEWRLLEVDDPEIDVIAARLDDQPSGTVVIWQNCDRIVPAGTSAEDDKAQNRFHEFAEELMDHLSLVFHRFLEAVPPVTIRVSGNKLKPFDPFLSREPSSQPLTQEVLRLHGHAVTVTPWVLPHTSKLHPDVYNRAAGRRGWTQSQGFYVYRNKRLLVDGDWLGLGLKKEEHYKLARIQVDIPNTLDADWQIDVRKARATPPAALRDRLLDIAVITRKAASDIYRHRGARLGGAYRDLVLLWERKVTHNKPRYQLNRSHPAVKRVLDGDSCSPGAVESLLKLIEETVPIPTITIDVAEFPDQQREPFEHQGTAELVTLGVDLAQAMRSAGSSLDDALARLSALEPFNRLPHVVQSVSEEIQTNGI